MEYRNQKSMPRWKASLISGVVIVAGFYALADLEARNNKSFQKKAALETTQQHYGMIDDSINNLRNPAKANKSRIISER